MTCTTMPQDTANNLAVCFTLMGLELQTFLVFKSLVSLWDAVMYMAVINVCAFLCLQVAALHASFYQAGFSCAI